MPLTIIDRKGTKYLRGTVRGIAIYESTKTKNAALAEAIRISRENQLLHESVLGPRASRTFEAAAIEYVEAREPGRSQRDAILGAERADGSLSPCLLTDFGAMLCAKIDQDAVDRVIKRRFRGRSPATIQRALLTPLKAVLHFAAKKKYCDIPAFDPPQGQQSRGRTRWCDYDEADRLLRACSPHIYHIVLFLLLTGARIGETLALEWGDVDLAGNWCIFRNTKRNKRGHLEGEARGVPLHPQLVMMLANLRRRPGQAQVFLTPDGEPYAARDGGGHIKTGWRAALRRAGIADLRVHDLRHTFATWLMLARVPDRIREEIMGHQASSMGSRYAHVPKPEIIDAVSLLQTRAKSVHQYRTDRGLPKKINDMRLVG